MVCFLGFFLFCGFFLFFCCCWGFFWGAGCFSFVWFVVFVVCLRGLLIFFLWFVLGVFLCWFLLFLVVFVLFIFCWFFIFFRGEVFQFPLVCCFCCLFVWGWGFFVVFCGGRGGGSGGCVGFCFYFNFLYIFLPDYRLHDFFIEVMQSRTETAPALCHHQIPPLRSFAVFQCHRYIRGRYVRIRKQGPAEFFDVLALCEVEVKGYKIGRVTSYSSVRF